ncbi:MULTISPECIES: hypothetical protein [unclassified Myxococcus]|uniref:hypothetical protein n=1 Tax=unclassified Myxococcus TaxID=2648731 RepID=UPI00157B63C0|nr:MULTISPECIES: hypothetical protein [unclassified Myxococcus]NTX41672.1 hypothetical protein [Myxococcus sp. CA033]NTX54285.1 hypothetical protein [Myxococcus sp. CA039A]
MDEPGTPNPDSVGAVPLEAPATRDRESHELVSREAALTTTSVLGRFARYCGKVNSHQGADGAWLADPDCSSGCNVGGLAYCQKFWPGSTTIQQVAVSEKANNVWRNAGCSPVVDDWDGHDEFECVGSAVCGDDTCNSDSGETPSSCPADCGTCGDGVCNSGENYVLCSADCGVASSCGDGACNNNETSITCASDCRAPSLVTNADFPAGVLQFTTEEDFNSLFHTLAANSIAANSLPSGFANLKSYLAQFPVNETTYEVDRAEYLRDLKQHIAGDAPLRELVNPDLQVLAGGKMYQFTDIGLFKVDLDKLSSFRTWLSANQERIDFDPTFTAVPGETALGDGQYQVAAGIVRIDLQQEKMAGSDTTPVAPTLAPSSLGPNDLVLGKFVRYCGKVNNHQSPGGNWTPDPNCSSGCNIGGLPYCKKFWPASTAIRQVTVSPKQNTVWTNAGCAPIIDDWDGNDEYECVQENVCQSTPTFINDSVGSGFNKEISTSFGDRRFILKTRKTNLVLFRSISMKGKLQRRKKAWFVQYWGPSYADELVIGIDNMDLHTSHIFPTPQTFGAPNRPNFTGIFNFKIGNWTLDVAGIQLSQTSRRLIFTQPELASFINSQFNSLLGGIANNLWTQFEHKIINAIDPGYVARLAAYTKKVDSLNEQNKFRITLGQAEKNQGYSHEHNWVFDWNVMVGAKPYSYDMRAGSFYGKARVGCNWYGLRIVRQ